MSKVFKNLQRVLLMFLIVISLLPFYIMVVGGFKQNFALFQIPPDILPFKTNTLENYIYLIGLNILDKWLLNSVRISVCITIIALFVGTCAGYAFAKKDFPGKKILFAVLLATMMIPRQILMVPTFILIKNMGLYGSTGLILTTAAMPFGVFLLKQFIQTLPNELIESTRIDGCSEIRTFTSLIIPLSKPAIGALAIFVFIISWNDFLWQLILLSGQRNYTMPLALAMMVQEKLAYVGYQLAGAVIAALPMIIIFLAFQKYFIKGITVGAVKG